jgi:tetratricopeptide (TPR) repeat protein
MKIYKSVSLLILLLCQISVFSQDSLSLELKKLADSKQFDKIIQQYAGNPKEYSAKSLYWIGLAYYMKEDDNNCVKFMNLSLEKDAKDPNVLFIKAATLNYMGQFEEAAKSFGLAVALRPDDPVYYSGLGDAYYNLKKMDLAINAYQTATEKADCPDRPYSMIAQIYTDKKDSEKALQAFYIAKSKIDKRNNSYGNALYNIGLLELGKEDYTKAEVAFMELLELDASDFHTCAKLIQVYYGQKEYNKAKPYKEKLYAAHKKDQLKDNLKDMFCFDQFAWKGKQIRAFERFEEGSKKIYNKHIFYVLDQAEKIEFRIQTEYSPILAEMGGGKYILCMSKGNSHATYGITISDDFNYNDLKKHVIEILEDKIKPVAASNFGN